LNTRIEILTKK